MKAITSAVARIVLIGAFTAVPRLHSQLKECILSVITVGLVLVSSGVRVEAQRSWVEVKSPHFTVVSNDGEGSARAISWQLEQVRGVIERLWTWARVDTTKPILIFAVRDEASMKALAPQFWEQKGGVRPGSVFIEGVDRFNVALRADLKADDREGVNPYVTAYWSYVALVLNSSFDGDLPLWFQRGLAGVFSNTIVRDSSIQLGRVIPWYLQRLRQGSRLNVRELLAVDRQSPWYTQGDRLDQFDAESWAFMHYLMFGDQGGHRQQLDRFMALLSAGKTPAAAVEEALGDLNTLQSGFSAYFTRQLYEYLRVDVDMRMKREGFQVRALAAAESASLSAAFHTAMRRPVEARAALEEAHRLDARLATPYETEGMLFDAERKVEDARVAYARAVELGSMNFYSYYRLASLMWVQSADTEILTGLKKWLDQSIALNGRFAAAYGLLGEVNARLRRPDEALVAVKHAVTLEPRSVQHRLSLARVLWNASRPDEGKSEARNALLIARTDEERRSVQALLDVFDRTSTPQTNQPVAAGTPSGAPSNARPARGQTAEGAWPPAGVFLPGSGVTLPRVLREVKPNYTEDAMRAKVEGVVVLQCVVTTDGIVADVRVIRSLDSKFGLDLEAIKAAGQWRFQPGTRMGEPVPVLITIELTFTLKK